jgi:hypothetical protein
MKTHVTTTDVFVSTFMGQDGLLKKRPVPVRDVVLASIYYYGEKPWAEDDCNIASLQKFAHANNWSIDLFEDDEHLKNRWLSFMSVANRAQTIILTALQQIDEGKF